MSAIAPRESDELILRMIRLRRDGSLSGEISQRLGVSNGYVRAITNDVRNADARESGEKVMGAYW